MATPAGRPPRVAVDAMGGDLGPRVVVEGAVAACREFNLQVVLVPLLAWIILRERPARRVLGALPLSLLGVLLISGVLESGAYGRHPQAGALFGLSAGAAGPREISCWIAI